MSKRVTNEQLMKRLDHIEKARQAEHYTMTKLIGRKLKQAEHDATMFFCVAIALGGLVAWYTIGNFDQYIFLLIILVGFVGFIGIHIQKYKKQH